MNRLAIIAPANVLLWIPALAGSTEIRFNEHIRPLLSEHCFTCHGPDSGSRQGGLRLDIREGALAAEAIVPGSAEGSELIVRITSTDPDYRMPPPDSSQPLKPEDRQLLARWIDAGAEWEKHWAFIKPQKVALPQPEGVAEWARNGIDHFVLEKLTDLGLKPNMAADQHTLARRAALDLTGLPPDKATLDVFLADGDEDAYERYVDTLLGSEHAGEHRARYWLDAARYGDTHGMHVDNYREIWPYRDWIIRAFIANMPFDQFVIEQIAGDLLPQATLDQRIATGFNRCNITTSEGGAISEEVNVRYMVDRVETTATVFLGLTAGCAVCHDHKYDPISQREFYQFGAFFNNTTQPAMDGNQRDTPPVICLPKAEFKDEWEQLTEMRRSWRNDVRKWKSAAAQWWPSRKHQIEHPIATDGLLLWLPLTENQTGFVVLPDDSQWAADHPAGRRGIRFGRESEQTVEFPTLRSDEPLTVSFWFRTPDRVMSGTLFDQSGEVEVAGTTEEGDAATSKTKTTIGWKITVRSDLSLNFSLIDANGDTISALLPDNDALIPRTWQHVCVRYSGGQSKSSITILVNGRPIAIRRQSEALVAATELASAPLKIASSLDTAGLSDIRIYRRWINDREVQLLAQDYLLQRLLSADTAWAGLKSTGRQQISRYYDEAIDPDYRKCTASLAETQRRRDFIYARSTTTLVMQERDLVPRAWVLERGEYDKRQDEVAPGVPAVLTPLSREAPLNRLGLAQWLVDADNPLTARVMVNRLWQSLFGVGLVRTSEDFGVMGERPSHPDLLDWLAVEFVESGWDINHILGIITTSATYRQNAKITSRKLAADPENRMFARGLRVRLDAEVLRDQVLAVSGLLNRDIGGPSVRPYQPAGLWKVVAIVGSNTKEFQQDAGDSLYRRSLYTFWKRTSPPPSMAAFNAPTREQCIVRRERTNTPLQALVLMNDPQFVEAARQLAQTGLQEQKDPQTRAAWMLTTALLRPAVDGDVAELTGAAAALKQIFDQDHQRAEKLVHVGDSQPDETLDVAELAAWTMVANTIMNRDDFISKN